MVETFIINPLESLGLHISAVLQSNEKSRIPLLSVVTKQHPHFMLSAAVNPKPSNQLAVSSCHQYSHLIFSFYMAPSFFKTPTIV